MDPKRIEIHFAADRLDPDAVKVVHRLKKFGHEAYLVGGCVRDLLVDLAPKDFDIATSALPQEIRRIFRNSRIIGRRFRLIHVYFPDRKIIEVATFRAEAANEPPPAVLELQSEESPEGLEENLPEAEPDLLIRDDNVFGTAETDALRRDFTINALFYDVTTGEVIDYVHGVSDLRKQMVVAIGDPQKRLREDPVRIIRAAKFAARLKLMIEPSLDRAMRDCAPEIAKASPARVVEEVFKILAGRGLHRCLDLLNEMGVLQVILPPLATVLARENSAHSADHFWRIFEALERGMTAQEVSTDPATIPTAPKNLADPNRAILFAALVYPIIQEDFWLLFTEQGKGLHQLRFRLRRRIQDFAVSIRNPRKTTWEVQQMFAAQERLFRGITEQDKGHRRRRRRRSHANEFITRPYISEALQLMWLIGAASENFIYWDAFKAWQGFLANAPQQPSHGQHAYPAGRRRRRRRGRRRGGSPDSPTPSSPERDSN